MHTSNMNLVRKYWEALLILCLCGSETFLEFAGLCRGSPGGRPRRWATPARHPAGRQNSARYITNTAGAAGHRLGKRDGCGCNLGKHLRQTNPTTNKCVQLSTTPLCMTDWNPRAKPNKDRGQKQYTIDKHKLNAVLHDGLEPERGHSTFDKVAKICQKPTPKSAEDPVQTNAQCATEMICSKGLRSMEIIKRDLCLKQTREYQRRCNKMDLVTSS